jgi:hypothetical protein
MTKQLFFVFSFYFLLQERAKSILPPYLLPLPPPIHPSTHPHPSTYTTQSWGSLVEIAFALAIVELQRHVSSSSYYCRQRVSNMHRICLGHAHSRAAKHWHLFENWNECERVMHVPLRERERERERERKVYWQSNRWLKVGKYNTSFGWHQEGVTWRVVPRRFTW